MVHLAQNLVYVEEVRDLEEAASSLGISESLGLSLALSVGIRICLTLPLLDLDFCFQP